MQHYVTNKDITIVVTKPIWSNPFIALYVFRIGEKFATINIIFLFDSAQYHVYRGLLTKLL